MTAEHEGRHWRLVVDSGNGALGALQRHIDLADIDAVLISHLHPDHCIDLTGLYVTRTYRPQGALTERLPVYAPAGAGERLAAAYEGIDEGGMTGVLDFRRISTSVPTHIGPFVVRTFLVDHPVEAYGFRVEADGSVLAYSGDTDACDALGPLFAGADLVLADSAFVGGRDEVRGVHLTGRRAAEAALAAGGVGRLMLTHIPAWNDPEVCRAQAAEVWPGEVELARPDTTYEV
ncbi:MBL fold metallo-hydrolase [Janibacter limosus]|uniref:MBL fold metallo-hydrolase n=1 Tax=Janibacter limosus TaxID=53458 RepID=UPI00406A0CE0